MVARCSHDIKTIPARPRQLQAGVRELSLLSLRPEQTQRERNRKRAQVGEPRCSREPCLSLKHVSQTDRLALQFQTTQALLSIVIGWLELQK
jgi:hypothetical protein